jgi:hypothetical protein
MGGQGRSICSCAAEGFAQAGGQFFQAPHRFRFCFRFRVRSGFPDDLVGHMKIVRGIGLEGVNDRIQPGFSGDQTAQMSDNGAIGLQVQGRKSRDTEGIAMAGFASWHGNVLFVA